MENKKEAAVPLVRVNVTITLEDYLFLNRYVFAKMPAMRILRWLSAAMGLAAVYVVFMPLEGDESLITKLTINIFLLAFPFVMFIAIPVLMPLSAKRRWLAAAELREPRTYVFSEKEIRFFGATFEGTTSWSNFVSAEQAGRLILLVGSQRVFHIIPDRAFATPTDRREFLRLVNQRLPGSNLDTRSMAPARQ